MKATITKSGQVVIPLIIRKKLKLQPGELLEFDEQAPFVKAVKVVDEARMRSVLGCCKGALPAYSSEQWLDETRGPVEIPSHAHRR